MKIQGKLLSGYLLGAILTCVVGLCGYFVTKVVNNEFIKVSEEVFPHNQALEDLRFTGVRMISSTTDYAFWFHETSGMGARLLEEAEDKELVLQVDSKLFIDALKNYEEKSRNDTTGSDIMKNVVREASKLINMSSQLVDHLKKGTSGKNLLQMKEQFGVQEFTFLQTINQAMDLEKKEIEESQKNVQSALSLAIKTIVIVTLLALLCAIVTGMMISTAIAGSISRLKVAAEKIGQGDLDTVIAVKSKDEVGSLAQSFNQMAVALKDSRDEIVAAKNIAEFSAAELQESNEELRSFNFIFFHDLRTPLVNIKGFAKELRSTLEETSQLLYMSMSGVDEETQCKITSALSVDVPEFLGFIERAVAQVDSNFNSILTLSRLGRRPLKPEYVFMDDLVSEALVELLEETVQRDVKVTVEPLPEILVDRISMKMIVGQLLDNAFKYLDPARPGEVGVSAVREGDHVVFRIKDNGRGIATEDMVKIFDIFRRAGKHDVVGDGMGLPYVKTLTRKIGGRVWCESTLGVGSTFSFTVPDSPAVIISDLPITLDEPRLASN